jgi:hypothetical protein
MRAAGLLDWGNIPDWVQAVGSLLAFGGFAVGFLHEIRRRRVDDELAAVDRLDAQRQQARLVFFESIQVTERLMTGVIHNASDAPIFDIYMRVDQAGSQKAEWPNLRRSLLTRVADLILRRAKWSDKLEPTPNVVNWIRAMPYLPAPKAHLLHDNSKWPTELRPGDSAPFELHVRSDVDIQPQPIFGATFTDGNGRRWARVHGAPPGLESAEGWQRSRLQRMAMRVLGREPEPDELLLRKRGPRYLRTRYVSQRQSQVHGGRPLAG